MWYKGNPNVNSPPDHEVGELVDIINDKPETLDKPYKTYRIYTRFSKEGYRYEELVCSIHSSVPKLVYIETDVGDSLWVYPVIDKKVIATTTNATLGTHPEYMQAKEDIRAENV
jgi:hypothetical protein